VLGIGITCWIGLVITIEPSGKCFDYGGEVWPRPAGINHGRQEGFGCGSDAHTNSGLFGQVHGEAEVLPGQCRREPTRVSRIEQTVQAKLAGET